MIDAKDARGVAMEFMKDAYDEALSDLRLEEIELSDDDKTWLVTFSVKSQASVTTSEALTGRYERREYKIVRVDAENGIVRSMRDKKTGQG